VWLTFQEVPCCTNDITTTNYKVSIQQTKIESPIDLAHLVSNSDEIVYTVQDLYNKTFDHLMCLPIGEYQIESKSSSYKLSNYNFPNISGDIKTTNIDTLKLQVIKTSSQTIDQTGNELITKTKLDTIFINRTFDCVLCLEQNIDLNDGVIILSCAHGLCNLCLSGYIDSRLDNMINSALSLPCPACTTELDLTLLINFGSRASHIDLYLRLRAERTLFNLNSYKWCQSPNCNRILKADTNSNPYGIVTCLCGFQMCLNCGKDPHFPAKCFQVDNYHQLVEQFENKEKVAKTIETTDYYKSKGMRCPNKSCNLFVERISGCDHMLCTFCRKTFCWRCGQAEHQQDKCTSINKKVTFVEFIGKDTQQSNKKDGLLQKSFYHRKKRMESERSMNKTINRIIETIKPNEFDKNKFDVVTRRREAHKFLQELGSFLNEAHFICEYGYLLLKDVTLSNDSRKSVSYYMKSLSLLIESIENGLDYGVGMANVDELRKLFKKSVNIIEIMSHLEKKIN
jgi:hypothetical protein